MSHRILIPSLALIVLSACNPGSAGEPPGPTDQLFVAIEEEGVVAVLDGDDASLLATIDLSVSMGSDLQQYNLHNVQAGDGGVVWATAMPRSGEGGMDGMSDELVGVDAHTYEVESRIDLGVGKHAAHVVLDGSTAYVTAFDTDQILVVDLDAGEVVQTIALPAGTGPHGARLTPDRTKVLVAGLGDGSLQVVDAAGPTVESIDLPGLAVQTAVLPDGRYGYATLYDTKQVARYDLSTGDLVLWDLPVDSAGPVQIYPMPDGSAVWIADQGFLNGDPAGHRLVELDALTGAVLRVAEVGQAPHGVVVNEAGDRVWTTILAEGTVQEIDAATGEVLATTEVGDGPNGISCLHEGGAMP